MTQQEHTITPSDWHPRRVIVTGYYDGPTDGIIDFGDDVGVYCFEVVAFDNDRERRVSKLARVASEPLESIVTTLTSAIGPPTWPFWLPIWRFSDENTRRTAEAEIDVFCAAGETALAVLTDDTLEKCFAIRKTDEQSASIVSDWLSLFA